jgi:acetyl-CoA carboxylase biotin carboxyl carrier protein
MDVKFIEGLIAIFEQSGLTEMEYQEKGARIRLTRRADGSVSVDTPPIDAQSGDAPDAAPVLTSPSNSGPVRHLVKAGLSGVIYMAPAPDQKPFVAVGDVVEEGQTLGIVEAMKMLSPIETEWGGRVTEICVTDGMSVEAGTTLFIIEPEA